MIVPGLVAAALAIHLPGGRYDYTLPLLMKRFYPSGLLGLGLAALLASFMSGMAGNVTAFNTVWTFDLYQSYVKPHATDRELLRVGRWATVVGVGISIGAAYLVRRFDSLMDYMQLLFGFFNAPIFATFLLGMFWRRATGDGAFTGLVCGIATGIAHHVLRMRGVLHYGSDMAAAFYGAIAAWTVCFVVTIAVSLFTRPRHEADLLGLVYSLTPRPRAEVSWWRRPRTAALAILALLLALNLMFF